MISDAAAVNRAQVAFSIDSVDDTDDSRACDTSATDEPSAAADALCVANVDAVLVSRPSASVPTCTLDALVVFEAVAATDVTRLVATAAI